MPAHQRQRIASLALCILSLSLSAIGCSAKRQNSAIGESGQSSIPSTKTSAIFLNPTAEDKAFPKYKHIFVIIEENKAYDQIIGSPNAPIINQLGKTYGLASNFYGEVHPSEANYVAMLGGSTFGIHDDDAYYCQSGSSDRFCGSARRSNYANHTLSARSLLNQLEEKGLTWKGYFEDIPAPGSKAVVSPDLAHARYASKHNGFINFKGVQDDPNLPSKMVGLDQLASDLQSNHAPNYSQIVLNQCHEMHGLSECSGTQQLIRTGDTMIGRLVQQITHSSLWSLSDNSAIVITWDEDNGSSSGSQGCCGYDPNSSANFGGGHIATIVITNHGSRGVVDNTSYNHYSLLRTTEDAFGIYEYLNEAGNADQGVKPMTRLFAISK